MVGNVCPNLSSESAVYKFGPIDFILAACDVEGNFLVVKVGDS